MNEYETKRTTRKDDRPVIGKVVIRNENEESEKDTNKMLFSTNEIGAC